MVLLGKIALGFGTGVLMMGAYTFREGVIRVDVDENRTNGSHVHVWAPAAMVPMAMHFVPARHFAHAGQDCAKFMPLVHTLSKELSKYPEAQLVEVENGRDHVIVRTHAGNLQIDVDEDADHVHVKVPLETIDDIAKQLAAYAPAS